MSNWFLQEYSLRWAFSELHKQLVFLSHVVSMFSIEPELLLMMHIILKNVLDIFRSEDEVYNNNEVSHCSLNSNSCKVGAFPQDYARDQQGD